jgi:hypothetical protein
MNTTLSVALNAFGGNPAPSPQADVAAASAKPASAATDTTPNSPEDGHVSLSSQGIALSRDKTQAETAAGQKQQLTFPDAAQMAQLRAAGIPAQPAFMLEIDPTTHQVSVLGARPDAARIATIINTSA